MYVRNFQDGLCAFAGPLIDSAAKFGKLNNKLDAVLDRLDRPLLSCTAKAKVIAINSIDAIESFYRQFFVDTREESYTLCDFSPLPILSYASTR